MIEELRKPRYGAIVPVLNEFRFLPAVLGQLLKACDLVVVVRGEKSFSHAKVELQPLPQLDPRVVVLSGEWGSEGEVRNAGLEFAQRGGGCDYVFTVDSDEILTEDAMSFLKEHIARGHHAVACRLYTYWKTPEFEIMPRDTIFCPIIVRSDIRFRHMRVLESEPHLVHEYLIHHLSYVRTDDEVKEKLRLYGHAHQIMFRWYERVWKAWDNDRTVTHLHPVSPNSFMSAVPAIKSDLTAILREYGL